MDVKPAGRSADDYRDRFSAGCGPYQRAFSEKSSRIHIQSAYQLHSGYMFAGLSGLSLAAFIVIGGLFSSAGDKYRTTAFAITALIWMLFNIVLSIWFFISSLNILDDKNATALC